MRRIADLEKERDNLRASHERLRQEKTIGDRAARHSIATQVLVS